MDSSIKEKPPSPSLKTELTKGADAGRPTGGWTGDPVRSTGGDAIEADSVFIETSKE